MPSSALELLKAQCDVTVWSHDSAVSRDWLFEQLRGAVGVLCLLTDQIDRPALDVATRLKVVSTMAAGFDHIDVSECTRRRIPVGHTPNVLTETTADFAFGLLAAAARRIVEAALYVRQGHWQTWSPSLLMGQDLHGATLGIVGFGRIGQAVARRAKGFGMRILACRSSARKPRQDDEDATIEWVTLHDLLAESDMVSLHVPLTHETYHMLGKAEFQRMKNSAILVNTSRGSVVDSHALYGALAEGEIAYAALDVTDPEPLPVEHPLMTMSNCLVVPHIGSASMATREKMAIMAVNNLLAGVFGRELPHCVNPEVYRSR